MKIFFPFSPWWSDSSLHLCVFKCQLFVCNQKTVRPFFEKRKKPFQLFLGGGNVCGVSVALHHHHHHKTLLLYLFIFSRPTPLFFFVSSGGGQQFLFLFFKLSGATNETLSTASVCLFEKKLGQMSRQLNLLLNSAFLYGSHSKPKSPINFFSSVCIFYFLVHEV